MEALNTPKPCGKLPATRWLARRYDFSRFREGERRYTRQNSAVKYGQTRGEHVRFEHSVFSLLKVLQAELEGGRTVIGRSATTGAKRSWLTRIWVDIIALCVAP